MTAVRNEEKSTQPDNLADDAAKQIAFPSRLTLVESSCYKEFLNRHQIAVNDRFDWLPFSSLCFGNL